MQAVVQGTIQKAGEATGVMSSNKKVEDMKGRMRPLNAKDPVTSDWGVKQSNHDISLSASTAERKGPVLLEDNFGREKVNTLTSKFSRHR
jgi:catalase